MGVVISPESELGKELAKWEKPYRYQHYPLMLYKARPLHGRAAVCDPSDETFERTCQRIVSNSREEESSVADGWRVGIGAALDHYEQAQRQIADEAANVAYHVAHMSEKAQAEYAEASAATDSHVTDVQPVKRGPGRPRKVFTGEEEVDGEKE